MLKSLLLFAFLFVYSFSFAQNNDSRNYSYSDAFINASEVLPKLYEQKAFTSIQNYINSRYANFDETLINCIRILLSIQEKGFSRYNLPASGFFDQLQGYADAIKPLIKRNKDIYYGSRKGFSSKPYANKIFKFTIVWAKDLLSKHTLDSSETFLCNVFAGNILNPYSKLKSHPNNELETIDSLIKRSSILRQHISHANFDVGPELWQPTGKLKTFGSHPGIGFQIGGRNKDHEFDLSFGIRFISTPHEYFVLRNDSLYARNYFRGGQIGFDYTYYFLNSFRFQAGLIAGIGGDFFNIAPGEGKNDTTYNYLDPTEIGSFDFNTGFQINYFYTRRSYIRLIAKYNFINYKNEGGTNLSGNAISTSVVIGINN